MGYYKLNTDGTIQSRSKQVDNTWLPLLDLETKEDGSYYTYYLIDGTPDLEAIQAEQVANELANKISEAKIAKQLALDTITVEVNGKVFDGNDKARLNMLSAIQSAMVVEMESTYWKLADNSVAEVTVDELKEVLAKSIQTVGSIVV